MNICLYFYTVEENTIGKVSFNKQKSIKSHKDPERY